MTIFHQNFDHRDMIAMEEVRNIANLTVISPISPFLLVAKPSGQTKVSNLHCHVVSQEEVS